MDYGIIGIGARCLLLLMPTGSGATLFVHSPPCVCLCCCSFFFGAGRSYVPNPADNDFLSRKKVLSRNGNNPITHHSHWRDNWQNAAVSNCHRRCSPAWTAPTCLVSELPWWSCRCRSWVVPWSSRCSSSACLSGACTAGYLCVDDSCCTSWTSCWSTVWRHCYRWPTGGHHHYDHPVYHHNNPDVKLHRPCDKLSSKRQLMQWSDLLPVNGSTMVSFFCNWTSSTWCSAPERVIYVKRVQLDVRADVSISLRIVLNWPISAMIRRTTIWWPVNGQSFRFMVNLYAYFSKKTCNRCWTERTTDLLD